MRAFYGKHPVITIIGGVFALLWVIGVMIGPQGKRDTQTQSRPDFTSRSSTETGEQAILRRSENPTDLVPVFETMYWMDHFLRSLRAKDWYGVKEALPHANQLTPGTRVLVIEREGERRKVRVLESFAEGWAGYTLRDWVQRP